MTEEEVRGLLLGRFAEEPKDIVKLFRTPKDRRDPATGDEWLATVERKEGDEFAEPRTYLVLIDDATGVVLHSHALR